MFLDPFSVVEEEDPEFTGEFQETMQRADGGTFWAFLAAALLAQVGLFATSLGLMLWWFRGQVALGGGLVVGGLVALVLTVAIYLWHRARTSSAT